MSGRRLTYAEQHVACPFCGAGAGQVCMVPFMLPAKAPHSARQRALEDHQKRSRAVRKALRITEPSNG